MHMSAQNFKISSKRRNLGNVIRGSDTPNNISQTSFNISENKLKENYQNISTLSSNNLNQYTIVSSHTSQKEEELKKKFLRLIKKNQDQF